jgi:hypothetical protein
MDLLQFQDMIMGMDMEDQDIILEVRRLHLTQDLDLDRSH